VVWTMSAEGCGECDVFSVWNDWQRLDSLDSSSFWMAVSIWLKSTCTWN